MFRSIKNNLFQFLASLCLHILLCVIVAIYMPAADRHVQMSSITLADMPVTSKPSKSKPPPPPPDSPDNETQMQSPAQHVTPADKSQPPPVKNPPIARIVANESTEPSMGAIPVAQGISEGGLPGTFDGDTENKSEIPAPLGVPVAEVPPRPIRTIKLAVCGNGEIEKNEECDDGNRRNGDGCSARCRIEPPPVPVKKVDRDKLLADYRRRIVEMIELNKKYPPIARKRGIEGVTRVSFLLAVNGKILDVTVTGSSGHAMLDKESVNTLSRIGSFPPPPEELELGGREITLNIVYSLDQ